MNRIEKAASDAEASGSYEELPEGVLRHHAVALADRLEDVMSRRWIEAAITTFAKKRPKTWLRAANRRKLVSLVIREAGQQIGGRKTPAGRLTRAQMNRFIDLVVNSETLLEQPVEKAIAEEPLCACGHPESWHGASGYALAKAEFAGGGHVHLREKTARADGCFAFLPKPAQPRSFFDPGNPPPRDCQCPSFVRKT